MPPEELDSQAPDLQLSPLCQLFTPLAANWAFPAAVAELESFAKMTSLRIRSALWGWLVALTLLTAGCVSSRAKIVSPEQLPVYGSDPLYHTVYVGSDDRYHHFKWSRGLRSGEFLVDRGALHLSRVFSSGAGKAFLTHTADGSVDVLVLHRKGEQEPVGESRFDANAWIGWLPSLTISFAHDTTRHVQFL